MWEPTTLGKRNWAKEKVERRREKERISNFFITIIC
jgi:hypothetical protein